jgi:Fe-S-cluster containining protein
LPGEAEKAAELKGMSFAAFFKQYLGIDWWVDDTQVLAPAIQGMLPGMRYPEDPIGTCVFLIDGKCDIHEAKPFECRSYVHTDNLAAGMDRRRTIVDAWRAEQHQKQCRDLDME